MADTGSDVTTVPVKVPQPIPGAPPTLAEPASGPAAEMSGALPPTGNGDGVTPVADAPAAPKTTVNGTTESTDATSTEQSASKAPAVALDAEMTDAPATKSTSVAETNGAAASKKTPNGKRKSVGGVPEHKSKKLNKKKSVQKITHLDAQPGDYFFARLKGHAPWPSIICDEDMLPSSLLNTRPVTTKKADGTYNEAYAEGGKKVADRTFPIMFLFTNEFAWIPNTDLTPLEPAECKDVQTKSKSKALISAYEVAAEGHDIAFFKDMLQDHANAMKEEEDRKEAREAEKVAKADKKKRKSEVKAVDEDTEMADADAEPKKSSKKRKKDTESDEEAPEKPAKTPKTTKIKLTTNKTPATTEKKAKEPKSAKGKSEKKKTKAAADAEVAETIEEPEQKPLDPVEERKAREKEVLYLRHKIQKGFLAREQAPREEEMPQMSQYIKKIEGYPDLEVSIIRTTKINKVLKALIKLNTIPRDEEFQFKKRSVELLSKWNKILGAEPADTDSGEKEKDKASPATNGVHDDKENMEEKKDDVEEPKGNTLSAGEAVDKISAEVPAAAEAKASVIESLEKESTESKEGNPAPAVEKAPESAAAAAEAHKVVQANE